MQRSLYSIETNLNQTSGVVNFRYCDRSWIRVRGYALVSWSFAFWVTWPRRVFQNRITGDIQGPCSVFRRIVMNQAIISKTCQFGAAQTGDKARSKMTFRSRAFGIGKAVILLAHLQYPTELESTHYHSFGLSFLNIVTILNANSGICTCSMKICIFGHVTGTCFRSRLLVTWSLVVEIWKAGYSRPFSVSLLKNLNQLGTSANFRFLMSSTTRLRWSDMPQSISPDGWIEVCHFISNASLKTRGIENLHKYWVGWVASTKKRKRASNIQLGRFRHPAVTWPKVRFFWEGFIISPFGSKTKCLELEQVVSTKQECRDHKMFFFVDFENHVLAVPWLKVQSCVIRIAVRKHSRSHYLVDFFQYCDRSCMRIQGIHFFVPLDFGHVTAIGFFRSRKSGIFLVPGCLLCWSIATRAISPTTFDLELKKLKIWRRDYWFSESVKLPIFRSLLGYSYEASKSRQNRSKHNSVLKLSSMLSPVCLAECSLVKQLHRANR